MKLLKTPLHSAHKNEQISNTKDIYIFQITWEFLEMFCSCFYIQECVGSVVGLWVWSRMSVTVWPLLCAVNSSVAAAGIFTARLDSVWSDAQVPWMRSHWVPEGQQWMWSEQQTAWKKRRRDEFMLLRVNLIESKDLVFCPGWHPLWLQT